MNPMLRKMFSLRDLRFAWLLLVSISVCGLTFYADETFASADPHALTVCYVLSFALAVIWSAANYIGHIRMHATYRKQHDIRAYVEQLAMSGEDRLELQNYLEDYAADLTSQGRTKEEAAREAINQFKVKEFLSLSKHSPLFDLHAHYYLLGWAAVAVAFFLLLGAIGLALFPSSLLLLIAESIALAYGLSFVGLFFVYKLLDAVIRRKLKEHLS
ncbi:hypothetical protein [Cohnella sp. REN36]|uniref:hypothetical protein n=1 Tax=Cohnella sp. REN36 TaxID=2887347 RepID=UPI001D13CA9A|nr:hypothetical protein [Cohnella sp. REN36]MCC3372760.1 hypothetical protein [Cohnella sp. REN36]